MMSNFHFLLFGCLFLVSSGYCRFKSNASKPKECLPEPSKCFNWKWEKEEPFRTNICGNLPEIVATVRFYKEKEECGTVLLKNVINGKNLFNGTSQIDVAFKTDKTCNVKNIFEVDILDTYCLLANRSAYRDQSLFLDEQVILVINSCESLNCTTKIQNADNEIETEAVKKTNISDIFGEVKNSQTVNRLKQQEISMSGMEQSVNSNIEKPEQSNSQQPSNSSIHSHDIQSFLDGISNSIKEIDNYYQFDKLMLESVEFNRIFATTGTDACAKNTICLNGHKIINFVASLRPDLIEYSYYLFRTKRFDHIKPGAALLQPFVVGTSLVGQSNRICHLVYIC